MKQPMRTTVAVALSALLLCAVLTAGAAAKTSAGPASEVPAKIKAKGTLTVAADATYAPNEFIGSDGQTVVGMDADLAKALGTVMGLKVKVVNATFDTIIPGLAAGKYDLGMSSFTDTKARQKVVDFVTYFSAGTSFYVKATGGPTINSLADLCGHTVAVERGTTQQDDATAQDAKCKKAGKSGVDRLRLPGPERREPGALERPRPGRDGRLAGRRLHRQAVEGAVQADAASRTAPRRTGSRSRRETAWRSRSSTR